VLCAVTIPPVDLRSLNLYYYAVCDRMCMSSVKQQFFRIIFTKFMISRIRKVRQEHQTLTGKSGFLQIKYLTFHILDIMNIVKIILRNCCITDDIHMRPHTA
jgi:hypothetical protein